MARRLALSLALLLTPMLTIGVLALYLVDLFEKTVLSDTPSLLHPDKHIVMILLLVKATIILILLIGTTLALVLTVRIYTSTQI